MDTVESDTATNASGLAALTTRVTSAEGSITSHATDITVLESQTEASYVVDYAPNGYWDWRTSGDLEGWSATSGIDAVAWRDILIYDNNSQADGFIQSPDNLNIDGWSYYHVIIRAQLTSATGAYEGNLYWQTDANPSYHPDRIHTFSEPRLDDHPGEYMILHADLRGHAHWDGQTIKRIRLDLFGSGEGRVLVDWVAIGRSTLPVSSSEVAAQASAVSALDARITTNEGEITSQSSSIVTLQNNVSDNTNNISTNTNNISTNTNDISANSSALTSMNSRVFAAENELVSHSSQLTALENNISTEMVKAWDFRQGDAMGWYKNPASTMDWYATTTVGWYKSYIGDLDPFIVSPAIPNGDIFGGEYFNVYVRLGMSGITTAAVMQVYYTLHGSSGWKVGPFVNLSETPDFNIYRLEMTGEWRNSNIHSIRLDISDQGTAEDRIYIIDWVAIGRPGVPGSAINIAANSSAITILESDVSTLDGTVSSQGSSITQLQNSVSTLDGEVSGNTNSISSLTGRVTATENDITAQNEDLTYLRSSIFLDSIEDTYWDFRNSNARGWTEVGSGELVPLGSTMQWRALTDNDSWIESPSFNLDGYLGHIFGIRLRHVSGPHGWEGAFRWTTTDSTSFDSTKTVYVSNSAVTDDGSNAYQELVVDLAGNPWWSGKTITGLRLDISNAPNAAYNIEFIAIMGRGVPASAEGLRKVIEEHTATAVAVNQLQTDVSVIDGEVTANASAITQVSTTVGSNTASIQTNATSINGIEAEYSVKLDVNGHISGFGLINGGQSSVFAVAADRFYITRPAGGTAPNRVPFYLDTNDGAVYMTMAMIRDAAIYSAKIGTAAVTNAKIANLAVTNAKIANAAIDSAKIGFAAIDTAHIKNLSVDSLKVKSGAISQTISSYHSGTVELSTAYTTVRSAYVNNSGLGSMTVSVGGRVQIWSNATNGNTIYVRVLRGATTIYGPVAIAFEDGSPQDTDNNISFWGITIKDLPATGGQTYSFQAYVTSTTGDQRGTITAPSIVVHESKR